MVTGSFTEKGNIQPDNVQTQEHDTSETVNPENITEQPAQEQQQHEVSSFLETEFFEHPTGRLANQMKVDNIIFNCGLSKRCGGGAKDTVSLNSILDTAVLITNAWKRQAEALALAPVDALEFYRRQYDNLTDVLSVSLFGKSTFLATVEDHKQEVKSQKSITGVKRKRAATNNDCEYIVFEKGDKFMCKRLESAKMYADKCKLALKHYICIAPKDDDYREEAKSFASKIKKFYPKLMAGNEIHFVGSLVELHQEICKIVNSISMDQFVSVDYIENSSKDDENIGEQLLSPPPKKRAKTKELKKTAVEDVFRTYVEENTEHGAAGTCAVETSKDETEYAINSILSMEREISNHIENSLPDYDLPGSTDGVQDSTTTKTDQKNGSVKKNKKKSVKVVQKD